MEVRQLQPQIQKIASAAPNFSKSCRKSMAIPAASPWFKPWLVVVCKMPCFHHGYVLLQLVVAIRPQTDSTLDEQHELLELPGEALAIEMQDGFAFHDPK